MPPATPACPRSSGGGPDNQWSLHHPLFVPQDVFYHGKEVSVSEETAEEPLAFVRLVRNLPLLEEAAPAFEVNLHCGLGSYSKSSKHNSLDPTVRDLKNDSTILSRTRSDRFAAAAIVCMHNKDGALKKISIRASSVPCLARVQIFFSRIPEKRGPSWILDHLHMGGIQKSL